MPKHDFSALRAHYPEIIAQMSPVLNSHQFILRLAQEHQDLYVEALYAYRDSVHRGRPTPFMVVHQVLSQLLGEYPSLVRRDGDDHQSHDILGQPNYCARWRKVR